MMIYRRLHKFNEKQRVNYFPENYIPRSFTRYTHKINKNYIQCSNGTRNDDYDEEL